MLLRLGFSLLLACLGAAVARGQVTFTFVGTAQDTALGYCANEPVTFTVTLAPTFGQTEYTYFDGGNNWQEENYGEPQLFLGVTGTKLTGSFVRPGDMSENYYDPYSYLYTSWDGKYLELEVSTDGSSGIGLGLPSGGILYDFYAEIDIPAAPFPPLSCYIDPAAYFLSHAGTYGDLCASYLTLYDTEDNWIDFNITSLTISAIPEPSTYAGVFGAAALGVAGIRRLNRKKAEVLKS